jgi:outer membrane lipoprotein-sorting protein
MGENTPTNVQKVLPLDVSVEEFLNYLVGNFKSDESDSVVIKFLEEKKVYNIYYHGKNKRVLWLDPETLTITRCTVYDEEEELRSIVTYSDFEEIEGIMFPMDISIKFPNLDARIEVRYDEVEINDKLKDTIFTLDVPEKARIIDLDTQKL